MRFNPAHNFLKFLLKPIQPLYISLGDLNPIKIGNDLIGDVFSTPDQPEAPDYQAAAEATAEGNIEAARYATMSNRPNQYTPWGTSTWSQDPNNQDLWTHRVTLSPEQQNLFDLDNQTKQRMAELGLAGIAATSGLFSSPYQTPESAQLGSYGDKRKQVMDAMLARSTTDIGRQRDTRRAELIAQGIPPGTEAFDREMERLDRMSVDARQQAEIAASQMAAQESQSDINRANQIVQNALLERQTPLNELNAFRSGSQVQQPKFDAFSQQATTAGPDIMGATMAQGQWDLAGWNADVARQNAMMQGLFGVGAAFAGRPA